MTNNTAPMITTTEPDPIPVPNMRELTRDSLINLANALVNSADRWAKDTTANYEYTSPTVLQFQQDLDDVVSKFCSLSSISEFERLIPRISLSRGANEGYQVNVTLERMPSEFPVSLVLGIRLVHCKVWDSKTQYRLAEHFENVLCW